MEKLYKELNTYLADLVVSYVKLHDLHWNVKGKQFVEVHKYTEGLYENFADKFDAVAERIIMSGYQPVSSLKEYLAIANVKELNKGYYKDAEVLDIVLEDLKLLRNEARELRVAFDEARIFEVSNLLDGDLEGYDKDIWFLESMLK